MRVPDDVTLLLCDDNWGNIRKLPKLTDPPRKGGYGIYYHFDYVGGPRNYKWINTNNIARVWEQMHLAYEYGVKQIWIVNVGDIKPMEFPTSFFLDYAWNTKAWNEDNLTDYYTQWAEEQFGASYAEDIGEVIKKYSQFNARRKPELLSPDTYSLTNYDEAKRVVDEYNELLFIAEKIDAELPIEYKDAYFQLVLHPVKASANLNEMYFLVALNRQAAGQGSSGANVFADQAKRLYEKDSLISLQYHKIGNGKWNHMMDQTHIGYTYWQQPPVNKMPEVRYVKVDPVVSSNTIVEEVSISSVEVDPAIEIPRGNFFYELDGYVSIEATNWSRAVQAGNIKWKKIPDIGRTGSGITTFPVTVSATLSHQSSQVGYDFYCYDSGNVKINLYFSPTLNFHNGEGSRFAVSIDAKDPEVINLNKEDNHTRTWEGWVANNIIIKSAEFKINKSGKHTLRYWMIDPGIVLQKIVLDFGGLKPSYLGPPETKY
jgi:Glycosyl hydrolase family 115/Gylcosyl hydrolase family 115 C-terminal domain